MAPVNPPQYLQAGSYTARNDRLMVGSMMAPQPGTGPLAVRSGVRPQPGNAGLAVRQRTTPAMSVTVAAGSAFVQSPSSTGGCYVVVNDASHDVTITAAHPTLGRRDLIIARVYDAELSGSDNRWALEVVTGTPAGSPVAPGVPSGAIGLATVLIAANQTTIVNGNITDTRVFTTALGGTIPAPAATLPANPYQGMAAYDTTNLRPTWHNGTGWQSWMEDPNLLSQIIIKCTSTTRPATPSEGWHIYETDTKRHLVYQSGAWVEFMTPERLLASVPRCRLIAQSIDLSTGAIVWVPAGYDPFGMWSASDPASIRIPKSGIYAISWAIEYTGTASGYIQQTVKIVESTFVAVIRDVKPSNSTGRWSPTWYVEDYIAGDQNIQIITGLPSGVSFDPNWTNIAVRWVAPPPFG